MEKIAVLITCHNRKDTTLRCLDHVFECEKESGVGIEIFLVDDGSDDGTDLAVLRRYPAVHLIKGSGDLYWNGGMLLSFQTAMKCDFKFYMWVNDDTLVYKHTINTLLETYQNFKSKNEEFIVVGSTRDPQNGTLTYGGLVRKSKWRPVSFRLVPPSTVPVRCETMNGNCVLISRTIAMQLGGLDSSFTHSLGDIDYGLRARQNGFGVTVMPGYAGECSRNLKEGTFEDDSLSFMVRFRKILHPKGLPIYPWFVFSRRYAGLIWPVYWLWPYIKLIIRCAK